MERGIVKWFDVEKKFGFLEASGQDYFVHISNVVSGEPLEKGERVEFEVGDSPKGPQAVNVRSLEEEEE
jgi:cold shock CspA family protein